MRKLLKPGVCFVLAALLAAVFAVRLYFDYTRSYPFGSAPFYLYVLERGIEFLIPAAACVASGCILRHSAPKDEPPV